MFTASYIQRDTVSNAVIERTIQKPATRIRATAVATTIAIFLFSVVTTLSLLLKLYYK